MMTVKNKLPGNSRNFIRVNFFAFIILFIIIIALYSSSFNIFFAQDDFNFIPVIKSGFFSYLTYRSTDDEFFRPITRNFYFFICKKFFNLNYFYYHIVNILLHFLNSYLIFLIILQLTKNSFFSFIVSYLYSIHNSHYFAVFWISGIQELLLSFFIFSSFYFYLRYIELNKVYNYLFSIIFFAFAVFSKETALVFPMLILLYDFIYRKRNCYNFKNIIPYILLMSDYFILKYMVLKYSFIMKDYYYSQSFDANIVYNFIYFSLRSISFLILIKKFINASNEDFFTFLRGLVNVYSIYILVLIILFLFLIIFRIKRGIRNKSNGKIKNLDIQNVMELLFFAGCWFIAFLTPVLFLKMLILLIIYLSQFLVILSF